MTDFRRDYGNIFGTIFAPQQMLSPPFGHKQPLILTRYFLSWSVSAFLRYFWGPRNNGEQETRDWTTAYFFSLPESFFSLFRTRQKPVVSTRLELTPTFRKPRYRWATWLCTLVTIWQHVRECLELVMVWTSDHPRLDSAEMDIKTWMLATALVLLSLSGWLTQIFGRPIADRYES